ncbi:FMN-binding protein [Catellatospora sp. TT07R-123]|uniref:FMN-binding protein n=1 Tax=Catellatospora sp. TT07R-123 TaxID=2733863 RepID=UPI001FD0C508|nr:FMN-binding protein [Catellatospora sp. TT07R-123]
MGTIAAVVLMLSYRTSLSGPRTTTSAVTGAAPGVVGDPGTGTATGQGQGDGAVTVNGSVAQTRWGPVQVQVKIASGRITDVVVLAKPDGNHRDEEINDRALPQLRAQVIAAQSARIDGVSGATVTTDGYVESLQAALDAAHFSA